LTKLAKYLANLGAESVAAEALVRGDPIAQHALVAALVRAAAITDPARVAAMLARLPRVPLLRTHLRRLAAPVEPRQVPLL
jgi:hypothetical protein